MISGAAMLSLVIQIVIVGLGFWLIWWLIGYAGVPEPFNKVLRVIVALFAVVFLINLLLGLTGTPLFKYP